MSIKEGNDFQIPMQSFKRRKFQENESWDSGNVKNGKYFTNKSNNKEPWNDNNEEEQPRMYQEYIILEKEGAVDQVTINYADIASLQMLGIISLDNYYHLCMVPPSLLTDASYVIRVFRTILEQKKSKLKFNPNDVKF